MSDVVKIDNGSVFTTEDGTISGELELSVEDSIAKVRYAGNPNWLTVPGHHSNAQDLAEKIGEDRRDDDGNRIPFARP